MDVVLFNSTLSKILPFTDVNNAVQSPIRCLSLILCLFLVYIVQKFTPKDFSSKKILLLHQLLGCFIYSLLFGLLQPVPIFPHKVVIFTGPFRNFGSDIAGILFVVWSTELIFLSCAAITITFNHYIETMEQFKQVQKNIIFEFFRNLSVFWRFVVFGTFDSSMLIISTVALFISINKEKSLIGGVFDYMRDDYALIDVKSKYGTLEILGGAVLFFMIFYIMMMFFLIKNVWTEMEELRPSLSPRTFELVEQLTRLLILVDLTPIVFFFLPTIFFIGIPFVLPSLVSTSGFLIFFTVFTIVLYTLYPFANFFLLIIGFKYYRQALRSILTCKSCRPRATRDVTSTKLSH